ncbi:hypothetical protein [Streptomyces sp. NPDC006739]|uniref:hypothetical protein n=1 Tax=Streptomyces sp. NPDC006739 TaxID=3364763 RepID=UPI0036C99850
MSTPREDGGGAYGAHGAGDAPAGPPNVCQPQAATAPVYEEYADPTATSAPVGAVSHPGRGHGATKRPKWLARKVS